MLTKDCLLCVAREINDLPTLLSFSNVSKMCRQIVNQMIAFKESKWITTDYYQTSIHNSEKSDGLSLQCFLPEISDPKCHENVYHGIEIIEVTTSSLTGKKINYITRTWYMNNVISFNETHEYKSDIALYIANRQYSGNCLQYIYSTKTKELVDEFHKRKWVETEIVPCDPSVLEEIIVDLS